MGRHFAHLITVGICVYALLSGALFGGIIDAPTRTLSMLLLTVLCGAWWGERLIRRVPYCATLVDGIALAWVMVIAISWVVNGLTNRRSEIGAWYDSLALLTVLIVVDLVRRGLPRRWLIDGILLAGGYVIFAGWQQLWNWFSTWLSLRLIGLPFRLDRPSAVFGNANSLGTALVVFIFLALPRIWRPNRPIVRLGWGIYSVLAGGVLLFTESKGAWIGLVVGAVALGLFAWRASDVRISFRQAARIGGMAAILVGVIFIFVGLPLLIADARGDGRLGIYTVAFHAILERPLFGHGPDSFGKQLMLEQSIPPQPPHSHAHDVPLHVGAELGIGGLLALALTVIGWLYLFWRSLNRPPRIQRHELIGLGAACIAVAGHGFFDVTASLPALFLLDAVLFALAIAPPSPQTDDQNVVSTSRSAPLPIPAKQFSEASLLKLYAPWFNFALTLFIVVGGWWGTLVYRPYYNAISAAVPGKYHQAAMMLDTATNADPTSSVTWAASGYVHGLAALIDDNASDLTLAIHAYEQAVALEPAYSINWLNLAALYAKAGHGADAIRAVTQAAHEAPDDPKFVVNQGLILEQFGYSDEAQVLYDAILTRFPQLSGDPVWQQTNLRRAEAARHLAPLTSTEHILALIAAGQIKAAQMQVAADKRANPLLSEPYLDAALLEIRTSKNIEADLGTIMRNLSAAANLQLPFPESLAWVHEALGELALARGDQPGYSRELAQAAIGYGRGPDGFTFEIGGSVPIAAYFMAPLPRTLLPIVWYPNVSADLQQVLADSSF